MKNQHLQNIILLTLGMFCISTSGAIGRYITLPPPVTIWYRAVFALFFLGAFCYFKKYKFGFDFKKEGPILFLTGILMATHWVTYFYALQWSNVAVGMLSLFTYPIMTTLMEPLFFKTKLQPLHLLWTGIILLGVYFLVPSFDMESGMVQGLMMGLFSAFSYSIRNLILKAKIGKFNGSILMFYQVVVMILVLLPVLFIFPNETVTSSIPYIIFLALVTTAIGHTLFLNSFKYFSISTASIMSSMQPVFGILLAVVFLNELPSWRSVIGGGLILFTVVVESWNARLN